jgi:hypothetical protein
MVRSHSNYSYTTSLCLLYFSIFNNEPLHSTTTKIKMSGIDHLTSIIKMSETDPLTIMLWVNTRHGHTDILWKTRETNTRLKQRHIATLIQLHTATREKKWLKEHEPSRNRSYNSSYTLLWKVWERKLTCNNITISKSQSLEGLVLDATRISIAQYTSHFCHRTCFVLSEYFYLKPKLSCYNSWKLASCAATLLSLQSITTHNILMWWCTIKIISYTWSILRWCDGAKSFLSCSVPYLQPNPDTVD